MKTNLLRCFAVMMGLGFSSVAYSQNVYQAPEKWSNFNSVPQQKANVFRTVSTGQVYSVAQNDALVEELPAPNPSPAPQESIPAAPTPDSGPQSVPRYEPQTVHTEIYKSPMHSAPATQHAPATDAPTHACTESRSCTSAYRDLLKPVYAGGPSTLVGQL